MKYGEKTIAITLQRACIWAKKSRGGCLFCAIASQFGKDFHCAVQSDFFIEDLYEFLTKQKDCIIATTNYGNSIIVAIAKENIFGTQFHPEKSQKNGLKVLQNFLQWEL